MPYLPAAYNAGVGAPSRAVARQGERQRQGIVQSQFDASNALADSIQNDPILSYEDWTAQQQAVSNVGGEPGTVQEALATSPQSTYREYRESKRNDRIANALRAGGFEAVQLMQQRQDVEDWMNSFGYGRNALAAFERGDLAGAAQALNVLSETLPSGGDSFTVGPGPDGQPAVLGSDGKPYTYQELAREVEENLVRPESYAQLRGQDMSMEQFNTEQERLNTVFEENVRQFNEDLAQRGEYQGAMIDIERDKLRLTEAGLWHDMQAALAEASDRDVKEMFEILNEGIMAGIIPYGEDSPAAILLIGEAAALSASSGIGLGEALLIIIAKTGADVTELEKIVTKNAVRDELENAANSQPAEGVGPNPYGAPSPTLDKPGDDIGPTGVNIPPAALPERKYRWGSYMGGYGGALPGALLPTPELTRPEHSRTPVTGSALPAPQK